MYTVGMGSMQRCEKCLHQKLLLLFWLHFSTFIYSVSVRCSLAS